MEPLIETAKRLIAIPSTADNLPALHDALQVIIHQLSQRPNITIERFESNGKPSLLAYKGKKRPAKFRVVFNGHLDVVPGKKDQFEAIEKDGRLYGRGTLDMKIAALTMAQVFCEMIDKVPYPLGLQIVTDEEIGGENGTAYQLAQGVDTQLVVIGESTPRGVLCNESRGFCWVEIAFNGTAAHGAYPWNGTNAILLAQEFTQKLLAEIPTPAQEKWCTTANIATISTPNTTLNQVPDHARLGIDIRFTPNDTRFASRQTATAFLEKIAPQSSLVTITKFESSHFTDSQNSDLQQLAASVAKILGESARFIRKHGAADVRYFSQRDIPGVTLGLRGAGQHSDNEYVEIASIEHYCKILKEFLTSIS